MSAPIHLEVNRDEPGRSNYPADPTNFATRPLASLLLACHEQQDWVEQAVHAALAQTYSPLEIIISDDASHDATYARIEQVVRDYAGPHRVQVRRNAVNEGISAHFSRLAEEAGGELLFVAAGDDISEPTRVEHVVAHWLALDKRPDLIATDLLDLDAEGQVHGVITHTALDELTLSHWCAARPWLVGASHAWSKRLFARFGPMQRGAHAEDQIMLLRALLCGGASTLHEPLVRWRRGGLSSKRLAPTLAALRGQMVRGNHAGLIALDQHLRDAQTANSIAPVAAALDAAVQRACYTEKMLTSGTAGQHLRTFGTARRVKLGYRLRLLGYTLLPWPYDALIRLKARLRLARHADAAGRPASPS